MKRLISAKPVVVVQPGTWPDATFCHFPLSLGSSNDPFVIRFGPVRSSWALAENTKADHSSTVQARITKVAGDWEVIVVGC